MRRSFLGNDGQDRAGFGWIWQPFENARASEAKNTYRSTIIPAALRKKSVLSRNRPAAWVMPAP